MLLIFAVVCFGSSFVSARNNQIDFIENKGQWGHGIKYQASIPGGTFFMTNQGFVYNFVNESDWKAYGEALEHGTKVKTNGIHFHSYKVNFVGANAASQISQTGYDKRSYYHNYIIGNDSSKWEGHVGLYGKVKLGNIYNGIDVYVYNNSNDAGSSLKYDFIVGAGVNANQVKLSFDGVNPKINKDGSLMIQTTVNKIVEQAPYCYQEINGQKVTVASKYVLNNNVLSFSFPNGYNQNYPLVIDPNLVFATFSGATGSNAFYAHSTTFDAQGNTFASGLASGIGWPTTTGAYQTTYPGQMCVCLNKYSSDGLQLLYSTYFGATGGDVEPNTMRVNAAGELILSGSTSASDLPVTTGAYQTTSGGGNDVYVSKLSADGSTLLASTYVGGSGNEACQIGSTAAYTGLQYSSNPVEVAFDANDNVWVTSNSTSSNFPVTSNAYQSTMAGGGDLVLFELSSDLTSLNYGTYIGGSGWDGGIGVEIDPDGNPVTVGMTTSSNFPATSGSFHATLQGGQDGFVARINAVSGALINATYLGTSGDDEAERLNFDCSGNVYVAGSTNGSYPISTGAWSNPNGGIFVQKLTPDLSTSIYSTRVGAQGAKVPAFMVDLCGNVVLGTLGGTGTGLEITPDAFQTTPAPSYLLVISSHFDDLEFGSFYGTSGDHYHSGVSRLDKSGAFYQSVCCTDVNFPIYPSNVYGNVKGNGGTNDVVTFKFNFDVVSLALREETGGGGNETIPHCVRGCKSAYFDITRRHADTTDLVVHYQLTGNAVNGTDYSYLSGSVTIPANDTIARVEVKPLLVPNMPTGTKDVTIQVLSPCGCDGGNNNVIASGTIQIVDSLYAKILTPSPTVCANTEVTITASMDTALDYSWQPDELIPDPRPLGLSIHPKPIHPTTYTFTVTQPGAPSTCPAHSVRSFVNVEQYPQVTMPAKDTIVCINPGDSVQLTTFATPEGVNYNYQWSPATYLRDANSRVNMFAAPVGDYHYTLTVSSPLANCTGHNDMTIHVVPPFQFTSVTPADTVINYGDAIKLDAEGNAIAWVWLPVTYLDDASLQTPTTTPEKSIQYEVVGLDKYGCRDTGKVNIQVKYVPEFFIPTAFSPNGDGNNDIFSIENLRFEKLLTFKVYNRLGQLVFSTKNKINGWDGTFNGKPSPADSYFYLIEVVLPDGEHQTFKGDVTLIR